MPAPISRLGEGRDRRRRPRPGGTRYFDYHHTPDDTLDKVDPAQLRQNVAAWTAMLAAAADAPGARSGRRGRARSLIFASHT